MSERDEAYLMRGKIKKNDAFHVRESKGGSAGRASENKTPIVAPTLGTRMAIRFNQDHSRDRLQLKSAL